MFCLWSMLEERSCTRKTFRLSASKRQRIKSFIVSSCHLWLDETLHKFPSVWRRASRNEVTRLISLMRLVRTVSAYSAVIIFSINWDQSGQWGQCVKVCHSVLVIGYAGSRQVRLRGKACAHGLEIKDNNTVLPRSKWNNLTEVSFSTRSFCNDTAL